MIMFNFLFYMGLVLLEFRVLVISFREYNLVYNGIVWRVFFLVFSIYI